MDRYIKQLVDDINQVISQLPEPPSPLWDAVDVNNDCEIEDMSYIESTFYSERFILSNILQIESDSFPPGDKLNDNQIQLLIEALIALLEYHHYEAAFPDTISERTKYKLLLKVLKTNQPKVSFGIIGLEFCHYNEENCPVPGECNQCRNFQLEMENTPKFEMDKDWKASDLLPTKEEVERFVARQKTEQIRNVLQNFKPSEKNIEGIFNHCDRWCDRCKFTDRCTSFEMEKEMGIHENGNRDDVINYVEIVFEEAGKMLTNKMSEYGVDINGFPDIEDVLLDGERSPLVALAEEYMIEMNDWFETHKDRISDFASKLWNVSQKKYKQFDEYVDIVNYYMILIPVKVAMALKPIDIFDKPEIAETNKLATGKLVLVSIDKSINAVTLLMDILPQKADELIDFLLKLSQLKNGLEKELPQARSFIRKGLDE